MQTKLTFLLMVFSLGLAFLSGCDDPAENTNPSECPATLADLAADPSCSGELTCSYTFSYCDGDIETDSECECTDGELVCPQYGALQCPTDGGDGGGADAG